MRNFLAAAIAIALLIVATNGSEAAETRRRVITAPGGVATFINESGERVTVKPRSAETPKPVVPEAAGNAAPLRIITRAEWGADESLRLASDEDDVARPNLLSSIVARVGEYLGQKLKWPLEQTDGLQRIIIHHTASENALANADGPARMRGIYRMHAEGHDWGDIGYHYVIDPEGNIYEGRAGGDLVIGAHASGHNAGSLGISMMGNFEHEYPTEAALRSLEQLVQAKAKEHGITLVADETLLGHRDVGKTACPGAALFAAIPGIVTNEDAASILTGIKKTVTFTTGETHVPESTRDESFDPRADVPTSSGSTATNPDGEAFAAEAEEAEITASGKVGETIIITVRLRNVGSQAWPAGATWLRSRALGTNADVKLVTGAGRGYRVSVTAAAVPAGSEGILRLSLQAKRGGTIRAGLIPVLPDGSEAEPIYVSVTVGKSLY